MYPWLRPTLAAVYAKTMGKQMLEKVKINQVIQCKLAWFMEYVQKLDGICFFDLMVWHDEDQGHSTHIIHVDTSAQGIGIWFLSETKSYQCCLPPGAPTDAFFFFKVLAVCCAVHLTTFLGHATCLCITMDNTNTFDMFGLLSMLPAYNCILISTIDVL